MAAEEATICEAQASRADAQLSRQSMPDLNSVLSDTGAPPRRDIPVTWTAGWIGDANVTFTVLHQPAEPVPGVPAVLICPPFGYGEMVTHRTLRDWGTALAAAGHLVARIAYPSLGDSPGTAEDPGRLEAWTAGVSDAATWLRDVSGGRPVTVLGIELGGMLALRALAAGAPIDNLMLWSVQASGRRVLREMRALARVIVEKERGYLAPIEGEDGSLELLGYRMNAETRRDFEALDLTQLALPDPAGTGVLLLGRGGVGIDKKLRGHLSAVGCSVDVGDGGDFAALMAAPGLAVLPPEAIDTTLDWLAGRPRVPRTEAGPAPEQRSSIALEVENVPVREETFAFPLTGTGNGFAVLTEPVDAPRAPLTAVLLNVGGNHHIGPNREYVTMARAWAEEGIATVRADLEAIGDADGGEPLVPLGQVDFHAAYRTAQVRELLDALQARGLGPRFVLAGVCAGGYWSITTALEDDRVAGIVAVNFAFIDPTDFESYEPWLARDELQRKFRERSLRLGDIRAARRELRTGRLMTGYGPFARARRRRAPAALFDDLRDRNVEAVMAWGRNEPIRHLVVQAGHTETTSPRWPNLRLVMMDTQDHVLRSDDDQHVLRSEVRSMIDRAAGPRD